MALVSISEASKLTGKSRTTVHRHISTGKLSKVQDGTGGFKLDTSELIRVYGAFKNVTTEHSKDTATEQGITLAEQQKNSNEPLLKIENDLLKKQIELLQDHVSSLKQALVLLEHKKEQIMSQETEQPKQESSIQSDITTQIELAEKTPEIIEANKEKPKRRKFLGLF